jgi:hypothetical protein
MASLVGIRLTDEECSEWRNNPLVNPLTGRSIVANGPTYNRFLELCGNPVQVQNQNIQRMSDNLQNMQLQGQRRGRQSTSANPSESQRVIQRRRIEREPSSSISMEDSEDSSSSPVPPPPPPPRRERQITLTERRRQETSSIIIETNAITGIRNISKYEAERYIAYRLRKGFSAIIHPYSLQLMNPSLVMRIENLEDVCRQFNLNITRDTNISPSYEYIHNNQRRILTRDQIDELIAQPIRRNQPITLNTASGRPIAYSRRPDSLYHKLIELALEAECDLHWMMPRAQRDNPVTSHMESYPGTSSYAIFQDIQAGLYPGSRPLYGNQAYFNQFTIPEINNSYAPSRIQTQTRPLPSQDQTQTQPRSQSSSNDSYKDLYPNIASVAKTVYNSISLSPSSVDIRCASTLEGIHGSFKGLANKLKKICSAYTKQCPRSLDTIKNNLGSEIARMMGETRRTFQGIHPDYILATIFKRWTFIQNPIARQRFMLFTLNALNVNYQGQQGVGPGVVRSFVQRLLDELSIYKIFISSSDESTQRYFINPKFTPNDQFKQISGISFAKEEDYVQFYVFVGHVLNFILMNDIGLKIKLSHNILAHMIYKHEDITDDDYVGYAMMDFPIEFNTFINLMKNPDWIEASDITFNDTFPLKEMDEPVTPANFREYLRARYKYRYLHRLFSNEQQPNAPDVYERFKGLVKGMQTVRKYLRKENVTIPILDVLITFGEISQETIDLLIANFTNTMNAREQTSEIQQLRNIMVQILKDNGEQLPYDVLGIERPSTQDKRQQEFFKFIDRLLMFWTSYRHYAPGFNYLMIVSNAENMDAGRRILQRRPLTDQDRQNLLPEAHTCYQRIDIPHTYYNNFETMYRKLVQATSMVEAGIGNYGGSKKMSKIKTKSKK